MLGEQNSQTIWRWEISSSVTARKERINWKEINSIAFVILNNVFVIFAFNFRLEAFVYYLFTEK